VHFVYVKHTDLFTFLFITKLQNNLSLYKSSQFQVTNCQSCYQITVRVLVHTLLTGHNFHENLYKICKLIWNTRIRHAYVLATCSAGPHNLSTMIWPQ